MPSLEYLQVIEDLQPNVVVCPDLIGGDWNESLRVSVGFGEGIGRTWPHITCLFAGQGQNKDGILKAYANAAAILDPERWIIGFGQSYLTWEDENLKGELARSTMICDLINYAGKKNLDRHTYHLLGGRWGGQGFTYARCCLKIGGIDSIKPFTCARQGHLYPTTCSSYPSDRKTDLLGKDQAETSLLTLSIDRFCSDYMIKPIDWSAVYECKSA